MLRIGVHADQAHAILALRDKARAALRREVERSEPITTWSWPNGALPLDVADREGGRLYRGDEG